MSVAGQAVSPSRLTVVLTGGIGSGKSTVAQQFARLGVALVDTDVIAHQLTQAGGAALPALCERFGQGVLADDGGLDRAHMRQRAFADADERRALEAILHPLIRQQAMVELTRVDSPYAVLVVPLFVESLRQGRESFWALPWRRILVVTAPLNLRRPRLLASRPFLTEESLEAIIAIQASDDERRAVADDIIDNQSSPRALVEQTEALHRRYLALAGAIRPQTVAGLEA